MERSEYILTHNGFYPSAGMNQRQLNVTAKSLEQNLFLG